ncbi:MAG: protein kinase [Candidatus Aminicenantaceae bacterium]
MAKISLIKNIESKNYYTIIKEIGGRAYGTVYEAKQEELGRKVAIKVLKGGKAAIANLKKEAWVQGKMNHPNIVSVYGCDLPPINVPPLK